MSEFPEDIWNKASQVASDIMGEGGKPLTLTIARALMDERKKSTQNLITRAADLVRGMAVTYYTLKCTNGDIPAAQVGMWADIAKNEFVGEMTTERRTESSAE